MELSGLLDRLTSLTADIGCGPRPPTPPQREPQGGMGRSPNYRGCVRGGGGLPPTFSIFFYGNDGMARRGGSGTPPPPRVPDPPLPFISSPCHPSLGCGSRLAGSHGSQPKVCAASPSLPSHSSCSPLAPTAPLDPDHLVPPDSPQGISNEAFPSNIFATGGGGMG